jgi:hypothetical protein
MSDLKRFIEYAKDFEEALQNLNVALTMDPDNVPQKARIVVDEYHTGLKWLVTEHLEDYELKQQHLRDQYQESLRAKYQS